MNTETQILIHPTADVQARDIGAETRIWQFTVVLPRARIGQNVNICSHCFIENEVEIGNNVTIKSGVYLWDGITLEDDVFVGPNVTFTNDFRPRSKRYPSQFPKTVIKKGASLGANATILCGITIHSYAMVGAGSVVTKDIAPHTLWYGNPAQFKAYICYCGEKLSPDLFCADCGVRFHFAESGNIQQTVFV